MPCTVRPSRGGAPGSLHMRSVRSNGQLATRRSCISAAESSPSSSPPPSDRRPRPPRPPSAPCPPASLPCALLILRISSFIPFASYSTPSSSYSLDGSPPPSICAGQAEHSSGGPSQLSGGGGFTVGRGGSQLSGRWLHGWAEWFTARRALGSAGSVTAGEEPLRVPGRFPHREVCEGVLAVRLDPGVDLARALVALADERVDVGVGDGGAVGLEDDVGAELDHPQQLLRTERGAT
eukprot:scaffold3812_cov115-Isochrysis_galbana.AAC.8